MIRAILLDIDGTLTNSQKVITPKTAEALKKAQAMGVRLAADGVDSYYVRPKTPLTTEADAIAWLKAKAGIT